MRTFISCRRGDSAADAHLLHRELVSRFRSDAEVRFEARQADGRWLAAGGWTTAGTRQAAGRPDDGAYRWSVRALGASAASPWAGPVNFVCNSLR